MSQFNILYNNINSYHRKKHLINHFVENNDINCVLLVETKTKKEDNVEYRNWNTIQLKGNQITNLPRGGSIVQTHPCLKIRKENPPSINNPLNETIHFSIPFLEDRLHLFLVYIHPNSKIEENIYTKASLYKYAIIIGDFNINRTKQKQLNNFLENSDFRKYDTAPTFIMPNNRDTTPDIILHTKNITNNIKQVELISDLGSDHLGFKIQFDLILNIPDEEIIKYNLNKCNIDKINEEMMSYINSNREIALTKANISKFNYTLSDSIIRNTPKVKINHYSHELPPFIIKLIKRKRKMYREYQANQDPNKKRDINTFNKHIHKMIQQYKTHRWMEACDKINDKQGKHFYQEVNKLSRYKKKAKIPPIEVNGIEFAESSEKIQIFKEHFQNSYREHPNIQFDQNNYDMVNNWYQNYFNIVQPNNEHEINEETYFNILQKAKNTAPGIDHINYNTIKQLRYEVHEFIIKIYNYCLQNMHYPQEWKQGTLITIPKPNKNHKKPENYRPITLLPVLGKLFEKIIKEKLQESIGNKIPGYQFGFKEKSSTLHPLTILVSNVQTSKLKGQKSAALFLDINKAFDSVWHMGLLYKLKRLECPDYLIHLMKNLLEHRVLQIKIDNCLSDKFMPEQGVPQGSPLSPLLYNVYCYDIYNATPEFNQQSYILQFADDTALVSHNNTLKKTSEELQRLMNKTNRWFELWRLQANPTKSQLLIFNHHPSLSSPTINVANEIVHPKTTAAYLGIHLDHKLNFNNHTNITKKKITTRAKHFRALTYRNQGINGQSATKIYKTICRPMLEYGHPLFSNCGSIAKKNIEVGERKAIRTITKIRHPQNPLYNISNNLLYQKVKIEPINLRIPKLNKKFANLNIGKLSPYCITRDQITQRRARHPDITLWELINQLQETEP